MKCVYFSLNYSKLRGKTDNIEIITFELGYLDFIDSYEMGIES